jgi:hypothetical protein
MSLAASYIVGIEFVLASEMFLGLWSALVRSLYVRRTYS